MEAHVIKILKNKAEKGLEELGDFFKSQVLIIGSTGYLLRHDPRMMHGQYFVLETVDIGQGIKYIFEFGDHPNGKN